jgi:hypothetical protein
VRTENAVRRSVPFALYCYSITVVWYTLHGHHPDDALERREAAPWYTMKTEPAFADIAAKLRRVIIPVFPPSAQAGLPTPKSAPFNTPEPKQDSTSPHDHPKPAKSAKVEVAVTTRNIVPKRPNHSRGWACRHAAQTPGGIGPFSAWGSPTVRAHVRTRDSEGEYAAGSLRSSLGPT